ncbi:BMPR2 [Mytilus edulis]|uniref:receptor protein serine/threonine kinase n=1 Tax=Mytilus edulis TaxID=6550 RepID=A0A8S3SPT7_MYTED|nr:BMPR2 [Mytilus edulis]
MKVYQLCVITLISLCEECSGRVCISSHPNERELPLVKSPTVRCHSDYQSCFTRWDSVNETETITEQGCLNVGSHDICARSDCIERIDGTTSHNFCCCYTDLCNQNFTKVTDVEYKQITAKKKVDSWDSSQKKLTKNAYSLQTKCGYHDNSRQESNSSMDYEVDQLPGTLLKDGSTVLCPGDDYCFTVWQVLNKENDTEIRIIKQGCWQKSDDKYCTVGPCVANRRSTKAKYCCCYGNLCNTNMSDIYDPSQHTTEDPQYSGAKHLAEEYSQYKEKTIIISLVSVVSVALIIMGVYLLYRLCLVSKKASNDSLHLVEAPPPRGMELEGVELEKQVCRGRNSEVWQGTMGTLNVAIKMFQSNHRQLYLNEKYIYSLPFMEHENLLKFYGCEERLTMEGYKQYWVVLSYCPVGNLHCYLKNNTVDWSTFCRMALTIVKGLSHLHTQIEKGDQFKPTIAHRDINTRNILVNPDNTCIIGDLGFSIATVGSKLMKNGHYESAEQASLQDVGTLRYMAPELLDGAANLRESETSLKQIDIYALGLVIWEIATRCTCLYNGVPVPDYTLPYQKEAGLHPTFEEMQILVSRNKVRPKFSEVWKDYNQAVRALKDTMEDCWDHDAEARLTSMCVEERMLDMMTLWVQESKNKAPTPLTTTSNMFSTTMEGIEGPSVSTGPSSLRPEISELNDSSTGHLIISSPPNTNVSRDIDNSFPRRGMSVSNSTVETFIPSTPSEGETFQKNFNVMLEKNNRVLQPHQGHNPTVERNTHKRSDEELAISGNTLIYGNELHNMNNNLSLNDSQLDNVNENLDTSLVQSDVLNMNTRHVHAPIPYLQNQVHRTGMGTRPKNANIINAGNKTEAKKTFLEKLFGQRGFNPLGFFHLGSKPWGKSNVNGNVQSVNAESDSGVQLNERISASRQPSINPGLRPNKNSANMYNQTPSNHDQQNRHKDLVVSIQNGRPIHRPSNINVSNPIGTDTSEDSTEPDDRVLPDLSDEIGIAHMELFQPQKFKLVIKDKENDEKYSKSTSDISPYKDENGVLKLHRPDSLKLKGHNYKVNSSQTYPQNNIQDRKFKIKRRVKTPVKVKHGRFSLYDDRLMSQYCNEDDDENYCMKQTSASLYQIKKCCDDNSVKISHCNC